MKFNKVNFHCQIIRTSNKMQTLCTNKNLFPSIYGNAPKRCFRSISQKNHKQNMHTENSWGEKASQHASATRFAKKMSVQHVPNTLQRLNSILPDHKQIKCIETKRKHSRPWVDQGIDPNKQTIKNDQLHSILHEQLSKPPQFKQQKKSLLEQAYDGAPTNLEKTKELLLNKTRAMRGGLQRNECTNRQKINSCKIAMKKGAFPVSKKHYEQLKVMEYFDGEESISAINRPQIEERGDQFMTIQSLLNIVF